MSTKTQKKTILFIFFVVLILIFFLEIKNSLQKIVLINTIEQVSVGIQTNLISEEGQNSSNVYNLLLERINQLSQYITVMNDRFEEVKNLGYWQAIDRKDSYNNELQYYTKANVEIDNNIIEITSKKESKEDKNYTSGLVESTHAYQYGYFEFDIQYMDGQGIFNAIWFLPDANVALPEIDLHEMVGSEPNLFYGVLHYMKNDKQCIDYFTKEVTKKEHYVLALEWTAQSLTWFIDDEEVFNTTQGVPHEYMYILINQAIGGDWPGNPDENTVFPNTFTITVVNIDPVYEKWRE